MIKAYYCMAWRTGRSNVFASCLRVAELDLGTEATPHNRRAAR
jgi:hypothetical protein